MQDAELKSKAKGPQSGYVARQQDPHPNGIPKPKARTGFSLIEVLAAMAVVLVLTALLFPAFASAKLAAEKADTSSKLHQCVLALNQYVQDYGDGNGIPSRDRPFGSSRPSCSATRPTIGGPAARKTGPHC